MSNDPKVPQEPQAQEPTTSNCHHCHEPLRLIEGRWLDAETHPHCEGTRRLHAPFAEPAPSRLSAEAHYKAALEAIAYRAPVGISDFQQLLYHAEDTARAALSTAPAPAQGWQPIATAPKDGTQVWLWWDGKRRLGHWHEAVNPPSIGGRFANWLPDDKGTVSAVTKPTLWHALPAPPAVTALSTAPAPAQGEWIKGQQDVVELPEHSTCPGCKDKAKFIRQQAETIVRLERAAPAQDWQPIATAPKDGTQFLGWFDNGEAHVVGIDRDGSCYREMDDERWGMPTHWMPLPAPPSAPTASENVTAGEDGK